MHATWIVAADEERAVIYSVPRGMARLRQLYELHRSRLSPGAGTGEYVGPSDLSQGLDGPARAFAGHVAQHLDDARKERRFDELIVAAAPPFLDDLRESLSAETRAALIAEIGSNLVGVAQESLQEQVLRVL
jgi:hypothetical protein